MRANPTNRQTDLEGLVAELTEAAYGVALRHGFKGTFIEVKLGLWDAIRACQGRIEEFASDSPVVSWLRLTAENLDHSASDQT
jgi:hypothetical protein